VNPGRKKPLTREEVERRQAQAVWFTRDVAGDPDLADEIEGLSVEEYAERKGFPLANPRRKGVTEEMPTQTQQELGAKLDRLSEAIEQLRETTAQRRSNPCADDVSVKLDRIGSAVEELRRGGRASNPPGIVEGPSSARALRRAAKLRAQREEILDALEEAQDALDECKYDEAQEILEQILEDYGDEEED
jgi:paraquat-inducible protein B